MREKLLRLLGLMRRANALAVGETYTGSCARAGITDLGFACALLKGLAELEPERYGAKEKEMEKRRERRGARQSARNTRIGKRRTNG